MTTSLLMHPALPFAVAALLAPVIGVMGRRLVSIVAPLIALWLVLTLPEGSSASVSVLGLDWMVLRLDGLARIFAVAFTLYSFTAAIFAWVERGVGPKVASLGLSGAGVGVVCAGDLLTLFFFWEWLTVSSLFLIWFGNTPGSWAAGFRYLVFHLLGAMVMLMGILMMVAGGTTVFEALPTNQLAGWLILIGMVTNAAVPPLHAWISDAYPRASVFGTVFLAAFTTKAAIYALIRGFAGLEVLVWAGTFMALFGVVYAVLENDIRRLLTYHIVSQVGYSVAAVGLGTALALNGSAAQAVANIFNKGLLMMSAGAVIYVTGRGKLTELGQLAGPLRWTLVLMMIGAFAISGVPFFNGFVSKSMVVSAAAYADRGAVEVLLFIASMGTFLHTGLKLPWFTFFGADQGARVQRPVPVSMYVGMTLVAIVCFVTGVIPNLTMYALLPFDATYEPFTAHHFVEMGQLLVGTALGFWLLRVKLGGEPTTTRDIDIVYRQPVLWAIYSAGAFFEAVGRHARSLTGAGIGRTWQWLLGYEWRDNAPPLALQSTIIITAVVIIAGLVLLLR